MNLCSEHFFPMWIFAVFLFLVIDLRVVNSESTKSLVRRDTVDTEIGEKFEFQCYSSDSSEILDPFKTPNFEPIIIQVTDSVIHQLASRIFAIFIRENFNFRKIEFRGIPANVYVTDHKLFQQISSMTNRFGVPVRTLDVGVWVTPDFRVDNAPNAGLLMDPGRFGWFIPKNLAKRKDLPQILHYSMFLNNLVEFREIFNFDAEVLAEIQKYVIPNCKICTNGIFTPNHCENKNCSYLLAGSYEDAHFVINQINNQKLMVRTIFVGESLYPITRWLLKLYETRTKYANNLFVILTQTPSMIVRENPDDNYESVIMPPCEIMSAVIDCHYEMNRITKFHIEDIRDELKHALNSFKLNSTALSNLYKLYDNYMVSGSRGRIIYSNSSINLADQIAAVQENKDHFNEMACNWLKSKGADDVKAAMYSRKRDVTTLYVGILLPYNGSHHGNSLGYVRNAVSKYDTKGYNIFPVIHNDNCEPDQSMTYFIHYYQRRDTFIGVVGPACSEAIEPIARVSKPFRMPIIIFSPEGSSFKDRSIYPYIFRTIGENLNFADIFLKIFHHFEWNRVATIAEDGHKLTEYISVMEFQKDKLFEMDNKKIPQSSTVSDIRKHLDGIKAKNFKVIIADIHDKGIISNLLCEAYHLDMIPQNGYVWFLPSWLSSPSLRLADHLECPETKLIAVIDGHFSLSHATFGDDDDVLTYDQRNRTIGKWKEEYYAHCDNNSFVRSDYIGFAYDAVTIYGEIFKKFVKEDQWRINKLHSLNTTNRMKDIITSMDFTGVSGRIKFGENGARYSVVELYQRVNRTSVIVGKFVPKITNDIPTKLEQWDVNINETLINWMTTDHTKPSDGAPKCHIRGLANFLNVTCDTAILIVTSLACFIFVVVLSTASFCFWKRRYNSKMEESNKVMRRLGIDLLSSSKLPENTLDKWEVPKDRVVINRKLGEGAFGTVYGGEAQIYLDDSWTAIAVKTLKKGSSQNDRLDFLAEAESMKRFDHNNIIKLLGVCLSSEPIYTIMEFMLYGDLKTYLLARRHLVNDKSMDDTDVSPKRLTAMALDVARALEYLAENDYVHRDIASRNCLVSADRTVKIADFGMARKMYENDCYKFNRKALLPVRWMAPESLVLGIFTPASDMWSFGILLYEIVTFGSFPYQGLTNNQVLDEIKQGHTLRIPLGIKPQLESFMLECWQEDKMRPTAKAACAFIMNHPRLVTPSLDIPLASVQMPETESDQLELIPGLRKRLAKNSNGLLKSINLNNFDASQASNQQNGNNLSYIQMTNLNVPPDHISNHLTNGYVVSPAYNPIQPLINGRDEEVSKSTSSLRRYVPMCGFKKNKSQPKDDEEYEVGLSML